MTRAWFSLLLALLVPATQACGDGSGPGPMGSGPMGSADGGSDSGFDSGPSPDATPPDASGAPDASPPAMDGAAPDAPTPAASADPGVATDVAGTVMSHPVDLGGTTVPLTIHLPASTEAAPIVVFHHGFQLGPDDYASYGEHLASWGYVVVMPQMPGALFGGPSHRELRDHLVALLDWVELGEGPLAGRVDTARIALAGHSLGGKISLLTATSDARVRAVFGVDPVDAGGGPLGGSAEDFPSVTPELMGEITVPIVLLGETTNATSSGFGGMPCAPEADNFHQYWQHATSAALEIDVTGANHMSFLDDPACGLSCSLCDAGTDDAATTRMLTRRYLTAFLNLALRGQETYRAYLTGAEMAADVSAGLVRSQPKNGF